MSDFITNLVHRSAGLLPETAVIPPFQPHFTPDVTMAASNEPPIPGLAPERGPTASMMTATQKPVVPEPPTTETTEPSPGQPETLEVTKSLPETQQPDQPKLGESPSRALSPAPQDSVQPAVMPREAPATPISATETRSIVQPAAQPHAPPEAQRIFPATVEPQIIVSNTLEPPATAPPATLPPKVSIHQREGIIVGNERNATVDVPSVAPIPRPPLITSSYGPDAAVTDSPSAVPVILPAPTPQRPLPHTRTEVFRPDQSDIDQSIMEVRIGTVEVRASQPPAPTPPRAGPKPQGFGRFAQLRGSGEWE